MNNITHLSKMFESNVRLQIIASLYQGDLSYKKLKEICECTDGNMATHLNKLIQNQFILKHLREASGKERILDYCTRRIFETHGNIPLKRLGEETGYSERYLNQLFDLYTGLSPKSMCHVIRIQYAYLLMESRPELSLSAVAQAAGYADHSHMNREFHRFLNASAGVLRKEQLPSGTGKNIVFE